MGGYVEVSQYKPRKEGHAQRDHGRKVWNMLSNLAKIFHRVEKY